MPIVSAFIDVIGVSLRRRLYAVAPRSARLPDLFWATALLVLVMAAGVGMCRLLKDEGYVRWDTECACCSSCTYCTPHTARLARVDVCGLCTSPNHTPARLGSTKGVPLQARTACPGRVH